MSTFSFIPFDAISKTISSNIDFSNSHLKGALFLIAFNPALWNGVARIEYKTKLFSKLTGSPRRACYCLAFIIFTLGLGRDYLFKQGCCIEQVSNEFLSKPIFKILGALTFAAGQTLVLSSMYTLGIDGTYLGDYFGILKDERLTGFPFNVCEHPMYDGSTLSFLGTALFYASPAGVFTAGFVKLVYSIAQIFEGPFTAKIYAKRDAERKQK
ncbi:bifunctional phosphatidyl-N-methylethanolamine N-methyltransferase/phosphatidyl-N-dimethylethanolamine N-methyltransferase SCDLUD_000407 [Saccharomycodes ludwigii]|uniref:bifunctional phosphatidyl-N-methylethanolamine N-methyltransferase/phosphatidyl-N-dimethylethanolamine N-methyltransferase n=1 Tax=Saccharomycodes ludwigii TaxID=36035 RepID=UPI001E851AF9|nr:hypothetical protein SCDLUD_000407 [Saccharomycodes ludwigii]KAH3902816.1 hypothetical protein SCDLUD_000407 [Saccharomycodes ludwigii]